ncbi:MAG: enoyl-CoA hydratase/isomerase family protein [Tabrizicola sp.]|uniref:enoyl-CoA hydratase/isomerase family protein n=1 Tax=Tabrizicola sp. TaxID=2005166 RepID=UPI002ABB3626|nr:enoyl-CoA hydratase/isomerase family protein [Tabrizicola sp.]MDZ4089072.1 enoyl-CoA hydratase/isomerase family protein [Tabrizicola sp.]
MIRVHTAADCCTITLARPEKANALTETMLESLASAVLGASAKVLILTGEGKVFSAGADLDGMKAGLGLSPAWEAASAAIAAFPGLSIAALNGTLAGGAMGVALACDLRIAVPSATFFYPVMRLGYRPQPSDPGRLAALVGPSRAKMILLAGQRIDAETALSWGLIDRICPPDTLNDTAMSLAEQALAADPGHVAVLKRMTNGEKP